MNAVDLIAHEAAELPEALQAEVLDFIGYLKEKGERAQWEDLMAAQATSLAAVWDNSEDEVWNDL
jgi:hypothetical protein